MWRTLVYILCYSDSALWQFAFQRCNLSSPAPSSRAIRQPASPTELSFTSFEAEWAQKNMSLGETNDKLVNRWAVSPDYSMYGLESSVNMECKRLCKRLHRLDEKSVKKMFYHLSFPTQIGCCISFYLTPSWNKKGLTFVGCSFFESLFWTLNSCLLQKKIQKSNIPTKVKPFLFREGFSDYTFYEV